MTNTLKIIKELHSCWNINFHKLWIDLEIWIRVIKICNEKCIFCSTDLDNKIIEFKDLIIIIVFLMKSYWNKYNLSFSFTWWEPTIYPNVNKIISFVIKKWYIVKLETNAVNFSKDEYLNKFKKFKWKIFFFVSFHGHTNFLYNEITKTDLYNNALRWIKNLCNTFWNEFVEINCVINNINFPYLKEYLVFVNNNFHYNEKIILTFSMLLANKDWYDKYLISYTEIVKFLNKIQDFKLKNINIIIDAWWYCQLPFCLFTKINFINQDKILEYASMIDKNVWSNIMSKSKECINCKFWKYCLWVSDRYYYKYWDKELKCM